MSNDLKMSQGTVPIHLRRNQPPFRWRWKRIRLSQWTWSCAWWMLAVQGCWEANWELGAPDFWIDIFELWTWVCPNMMYALDPQKYPNSWENMIINYWMEPGATFSDKFAITSILYDKTRQLSILADWKIIVEFWTSFRYRNRTKDSLVFFL